MSLSATLSIATSSLAAAQQALSVTANNVANANTEGFTRKVPQQQALVVDGRGVGTRALDPQRVVDDYLNAELRDQTGRLGRSDALVGYQDRVQQSLFGAPGDANQGLANHIGRLSQAAETLANTPESAALKLAFIGGAQDLVRQISDNAAQLQQMRSDADQEISTTVTDVNGDIKGIYRLNLELARTRGTGASADLLDQRDQLLQDLSGKLPISVGEQEDGTISIYTSGGQALLEGRPSQLDYTPAAQVGGNTSFGPIRLYRSTELDAATGEPLPSATGLVLVTGGVRAALTPELQADATPDSAQLVVSPFTTGRLQGLLDARDKMLPELADQLGELADLTRFTLNAAHNDAVPSPPPGQLTGTRSDFSGWNGAANSGTAYMAVVDKASGATVTAFALDPTAASPAAVLAQINAGLGALGSASFTAQGTLQVSLSNPAQGLALDEGDSKVAVQDAAGHQRAYGLSHYFGLNDLIVTSSSDPTSLAVRPDIAGDGSRLSAAALDVTAGPPLVAKLGGSGDNRPAKALAAALQQRNDTVARGTMAARKASLSEYASDIVAVSSAATDQSKNTQASLQAVVDDLGYRQGAVSGVNADEELSRLVLYQQTYSVSARIISITDQLFDDLLSIGR